MYSTTDFRNGLKIEIDGNPLIIVEFQHVNPGKGSAFVRTKMKNLKTGQVLEKTFKSGEKVKKPDLDQRTLQYLYNSGDEYHFMDSKSYEQVAIPAANIGDAALFMKDGMNVEVIFFNGEAISVELPMFIELEVTETDPGVKGNTASGGSKPAIVETGGTIKVPLYLQQGELVKIDTRTREFVERVKK